MCKCCASGPRCPPPPPKPPSWPPHTYKKGVDCSDFKQLSACTVLLPNNWYLKNKSRGGTLRPKMVRFLHACSQGMGPLTGTFHTQLWYVWFQCSWALNVPVRGPIPNWPQREPYFLSSHMLYLTSQRTKLSKFLVFWRNYIHFLQK